MTQQELTKKLTDADVDANSISIFQVTLVIEGELSNLANSELGGLVILDGHRRPHGNKVRGSFNTILDSVLGRGGANPDEERGIVLAPECIDIVLLDTNTITNGVRTIRRYSSSNLERGVSRVLKASDRQNSSNRIKSSRGEGNGDSGGTLALANILQMHVLIQWRG